MSKRHNQTKKEKVQEARWRSRTHSYDLGYAAGVADEREACAKVADDHFKNGDHGSACTVGNECAGVIAQSIRKRTTN